MARCPFADWLPGNGGGAYVAGYPYRIVLHSTEGSTASGAVGAYREHNSWPHFTVDRDGVLQHVDTEVAARALKNPAGGVETNRARAVQIEVVGFAAKAKPPETLARLRGLCRWIEKQHAIPQVFPAGPLTWPASGTRPANVWRSNGGYYGHQQVPENDHVDPGIITPGDLGFAKEQPVPPPMYDPSQPALLVYSDSPEERFLRDYLKGATKMHDGQRLAAFQIIAFPRGGTPPDPIPPHSLGVGTNVPGWGQIAGRDRYETLRKLLDFLGVGAAA